MADLLGSLLAEHLVVRKVVEKASRSADQMAVSKGEQKVAT
jgi:hypothetical protein